MPQKRTLRRAAKDREKGKAPAAQAKDSPESGPESGRVQAKPRASYRAGQRSGIAPKRKTRKTAVTARKRATTKKKR